MQSAGKARGSKRRFWLWGGAAVMGALLCTTLILFLRTTLPFFYAAPVARAPIQWSTLPAPVTVHAQWTSYANSQSVRDVARTADLLWIATDGGLVVQNIKTAAETKFLSEHGLPSNRLTAVTVARDGRVWVGSVDSGMGEFDGTRWRTFTTADGLPSNTIQDIAADAEGVIWAATERGIARYDGRAWSTVRTTLFDYTPAPARDLLVRGGGLWVATSEGILFFNGTRWQQFTSADGLLNDNVFTLSMTPDGALWAGTETGLAAFDGRSWRRFTVRDGLRNIPIHVVAGAPDNSVWLAYADAQGVTQFDGRVLRTFDTSDGVASDLVQDIGLDGAAFWVGTARGLNRYDLTSSSWSTRPLASPVPQDIASLVESQGDIWVAGEGGVARFDGAAWRQFGTADGLANSNVNALSVTPDGRLHAAFERPSAGIATFSDPDGSWANQSCQNALPDLENLHFGAVAPDGAVWLVGNPGVVRFERHAQDFAQRWRLFGDGWPLDPLPRGFGITPKGEVWAGLIQGLYRLDQRSGRWEQMSASPFQRLSVAPNGAIWGATDQGVVHWVDGRLVLIAPPPLQDLGDFLATNESVWISSSSGVAQLTAEGWHLHTASDGLLSNHVTTLTQDDEGRIWAGYESDRLGFSYFDAAANGGNGRWQVVNNTYALMPNGLLSNEVKQVLPTPDGNIWFVSPEGLSRFDIHANAWLTLEADSPIRQIVYAAGSVWVNTADWTARIVNDEFTQTNMLFSRADYLGVDETGRLWAFVTTGPSPKVSVYDGKRWLVVPTPENLGEIKDLAFDVNGRVWILEGGGEAERLWVYDDERWQRVDLSNVGQMNQIEIDEAGYIWFGSSKSNSLRAAILDEYLALPPYENFPALSGEVQLIEAIGDEVIWVVTADERGEIEVHRLDGDEWVTFAGDMLPFQPDRTRVMDLTRGPEGSIWLGTSAGAARYLDGQWELVKAAADPTTSHPVLGPLSDRQNSITRMEILAEDEIWFGTANGDVGRLSPAGLLPTPSDVRVRWGEVRVLLRDDEGGVWAGSYDGRLARFFEGSWQRYDPTLSTAIVSSMVSLNGKSWLGTDMGVVEFDGQNCEFLPYRQSLEVLNGVADFDESVWWATANEGAFRYRGAFETPVINLIGFNVPALAIGLDGTLWFAQGSELTRYADGRRDVIQVESELAQRGIFALTLGPNGRPWVGTWEGITYPDGLGWAELTTADGLADNTVTHMLTAADGTLWFATRGGLSHYRP